MPFVRTHAVAFSFSDAAPLFEDVDLHLAPGWTGFVGANGCGKTTLLRILAAELDPTGGHVQRLPDPMRTELCPQVVDQRTDAILELADSSAPLGCRLRGQLQLEPEALARWDTLSPGERKRWQIGGALARKPELLLLDEPTNHLDSEARALLVAALQDFEGIGALVSHDRELLDALTTSTVRFHRGGVQTWRGSWSQAMRAWELEERAGAAARERLAATERKARRHLDQIRREQEGAEASRSTRKRMKYKGDSEARAMGAKTVAAWAEASLSRRVANARQRLEGVQEQLAESALEKPVGRSLFLDWRPAPSPHLFRLDLDELCAGDRRLTGELHLAVARDARIRIAGPNGSGKTTLLRALLGSSRLPADRLLYLPQELPGPAGADMVEELREMDRAERGRALSMVAALGLEPEQVLASESPSPGEARKLAIAMALGRQVWALVLDEPTNHLDLPSLERLEAALHDYPGALLLVSHDEAFARALTRETWTLRGGALRVA